MPTRLLITSALIIATMAPAAPASASQLGCGARDVIVARLAGEYGEVRRDGVSAGVSAFYEFYASDSTGTWTVLLSGVNGLSCIMAVGEGWRPAKAVVPTHDGWPRPGALLVR